MTAEHNQICERFISRFERRSAFDEASEGPDLQSMPELVNAFAY
jgi:hypothetical protein